MALRSGASSSTTSTVPHPVDGTTGRRVSLVSGRRSVVADGSGNVPWAGTASRVGRRFPSANFLVSGMGGETLDFCDAGHDNGSREAITTTRWRYPATHSSLWGPHFSSPSETPKLSLYIAGACQFASEAIGHDPRASALLTTSHRCGLAARWPLDCRAHCQIRVWNEES